MRERERELGRRLSKQSRKTNAKQLLKHNHQPFESLTVSILTWNVFQKGEVIRWPLREGPTELFALEQKVRAAAHKLPTGSGWPSGGCAHGFIALWKAPECHAVDQLPCLSWDSISLESRTLSTVARATDVSEGRRGQCGSSSFMISLNSIPLSLSNSSVYFSLIFSGNPNNGFSLCQI